MVNEQSRAHNDNPIIDNSIPEGPPFLALNRQLADWPTAEKSIGRQ